MYVVTRYSRAGLEVGKHETDHLPKAIKVYERWTQRHQRQHIKLVEPPEAEGQPAITIAEHWSQQ